MNAPYGTAFNANPEQNEGHLCWHLLNRNQHVAEDTILTPAL